MTRNLVAKSNLKQGKRYQSKRIKQNSTKLKNIKNREKRLNSFGWSLFYFE